MNLRSNVAVSGAERSDGRRISKDSHYWLISEPRHAQTGALTPGLLDAGRALPVFSFKEEAGMFLRARGASMGNRTVQEWTARDLLPVLLDPSCVGVEKVVLDPIADVTDAVSACLLGVSKERFIGRLLKCSGTGLPSRQSSRIGRRRLWSASTWA